MQGIKKNKTLVIRVNNEEKDKYNKFAKDNKIGLSQLVREYLNTQIKK